MGETQAPESPDVADPIVVGTETPDVADPIVVGTETPDVADPIVVGTVTLDAADPIVVRFPDPDERRLLIMNGDIALKVTIMAGKRISRDTLENLEDDVRAIFKRARRELQTVGEKVLAVGEQMQIEVDGQLDNNIVRAVNCGVDNHLWSTSVV
jgi:hypothetical protein